jgi:hypothetical protein
MIEKNILKAGAASVPVRLGADCFPNAECVGQHDDVYVRVVILESNRRVAILSADMPSMFPEDIRYCKALLQELAGVEPEDSWITVSHSFSSPHAWPVDDKDNKDILLPKALKENPSMIEAARNINRAYKDACRAAVEQAAAGMREGSVGFGTGACAVNINRNMHTAEGWWQGVNAEGYADKTLCVLRINDINGEPIAILYNYSIQPSSAAGVITSDGGKLVSSDLVGAASAFIEKEYGGKTTAVFLCGASGDQAPLFKINYMETDRYGKLRSGCLGEKGYILVEEMGRILGGAVVQTAEKINCEDATPEIRTASRNYICRCLKRNPDMSKLRPALSHTFTPDGEREMSVYAMTIGDIALVGMQPEMDGVSISQIREASPYDKTMAVTFVNGNAKSMPQKESYLLFHYTALNSPFAAGSAEHTCEVAVELLKHIKKVNK